MDLYKTLGSGYYRLVEGHSNVILSLDYFLYENLRVNAIVVYDQSNDSIHSKICFGPVKLGSCAATTMQYEKIIKIFFGSAYQHLIDRND